MVGNLRVRYFFLPYIPYSLFLPLTTAAVFPVLFTYFPSSTPFTLPASHRLYSDILFFSPPLRPPLLPQRFPPSFEKISRWTLFQFCNSLCLHTRNYFILSEAQVCFCLFLGPISEQRTLPFTRWNYLLWHTRSLLQSGPQQGLGSTFQSALWIFIFRIRLRWVNRVHRQR